MGFIFESSSVLDKNSPSLKEAKFHYEQAAKMNHFGACVNLGRLLENSSDKEEQSLASKWYHIACHSGEDPQAAFNLSMLYTFGCGGVQQRDPNQAISYLILASNRGHAKASYNLARRKLKGGGISTFDLGGGVELDLLGAMKLLEFASSKGLNKAERVLRFIKRQSYEHNQQNLSQLNFQKLVEKGSGGGGGGSGSDNELELGGNEDSQARMIFEDDELGEIDREKNERVAERSKAVALAVANAAHAAEGKDCVLGQDNIDDLNEPS